MALDRGSELTVRELAEALGAFLKAERVQAEIVRGDDDGCALLIFRSAGKVGSVVHVAEHATTLNLFTTGSVDRSDNFDRFPSLGKAVEVVTFGLCKVMIEAHALRQFRESPDFRASVYAGLHAL